MKNHYQKKSRNLSEKKICLKKNMCFEDLASNPHKNAQSDTLPAWPGEMAATCLEKKTKKIDGL